MSVKNQRAVDREVVLLMIRWGGIDKSRRGGVNKTRWGGLDKSRRGGVNKTRWGGLVKSRRGGVNKTRWGGFNPRQCQYFV